MIRCPVSMSNSRNGEGFGSGGLGLMVLAAGPRRGRPQAESGKSHVSLFGGSQSDFLERVSESRNAMQWVACVTMLLDHIGHIYELPILRCAGRIAMPYYCMLFVLTGKKQSYDLLRLGILAAVSQPFYGMIFEFDRLNIIAGFFVFALLIDAMNKKLLRRSIACLLVMLIVPVDYGHFLYLSLFALWYVGPMAYVLLNVVFAVACGLLVQLVGCFAWYIPKLNMPRIPVVVYRWYYPLHLFVIAFIASG